MIQTYHGSCHCGRVQFEADIDLSAGAGKCNCSICWKTRAWATIVKPDAFRLLQGEADLADYQFGGKVIHHLFCRHCGVRSYEYGHVPALGGDYVSINVACLDDLEPADLIAAPLSHLDGRNDAWQNVPAETRHL